LIPHVRDGASILELYDYAINYFKERYQDQISH